MLRTLVHFVDGTCGLGLVQGYNNYAYQQDHHEHRTKAVDSLGTVRGTGFFVAGFIDTPACKEAYEVMCLNNKMVYQSPVRRNNNSGNDFFFVIFDSLK